MNKRTPLVLVIIGAVALILMIVFYYSALEKGFGLEPLIELRKSIRENYRVTSVQVNWTKATRKELKKRPIKGPGTTWVVIEVVPEDSKLHKDKEKTDNWIADIFRHSRNNYTGKRKRIVGFRIRCYRKKDRPESLFASRDQYLRQLPESKNKK